MKVKASLASAEVSAGAMAKADQNTLNNHFIVWPMQCFCSIFNSLQPSDLSLKRNFLLQQQNKSFIRNFMIFPSSMKLEFSTLLLNNAAISAIHSWILNFDPWLIFVFNKRYFHLNFLRSCINIRYRASIFVWLGPSPRLKPEGKGLDQSRTLNSHSTTTTNLSTSSRTHMQFKVGI